MRFVFFTALLLAFCPNHGKFVSAVVPGYLDFDNLPDTNFSCDGKVIGGYYADVETGCQMFHVCTIGQKGEITDIKFLCLNGTVFDQETRVCERVDEVDCSKTEGFYDLNLELYGNNAALSYHETEEDPVTIPTLSSTPSTTTTTTTTTTTAAPLSLAGRTPAGTHYSSTPSPAVAAALLGVHHALAHHRQQPQPHLTVQGGGSSGVLNPVDAFQSLKTSAQPQQFIFSTTTAKYSSPPPPPQLHYQPAHHIFTTPSVAVVSSTRSVSSVKGKPGDGLEGQSRVPINNFAFGINTGLNPPHFSAENASGAGHQVPELGVHDPYDEYREVDAVSLDPFFRDVPRITKQSDQVQRQKRATGRGGRGRFRPSLESLKEESGEEEPSPEESGIVPVQVDGYFQKRRRPAPAPKEEALPTAEAFFRSTAIGQRQQAENVQTNTLETETTRYPMSRRGATSDGQRQRQPYRESSRRPPAPQTARRPVAAPVAVAADRTLREEYQEEGSSPERSEIFPARDDSYFQKRRRPSLPAPQEDALPTAEAFFRSTAIGQLQQAEDVQTTTVATETTSYPTSRRGATSDGQRQRQPYRESSRRLSAPQTARRPVAAPVAVAADRTLREEYQEEGSSPEGSEIFPARDDGYFQKRRRPAPPAPQEDALPTAEAFFRSTAIGQLQQAEDVQTTTVATEATSNPASRRGAATVGQRLPSRESSRRQPAVQTARRPAAVAADAAVGRTASRRGELAHRRAGAPSRRPSYQPGPTFEQATSTQQPQQLPQPQPQPQQQRQSLSQPQQQQSQSQQRQAQSQLQQPQPQPEKPPALPVTSFSCADKVPGGYYADLEADCQLFHICSQGRHGRITDNQFMCGPGTRFNQQSRTCQARELVDCSISASLYHLNNHFQLDRQEDVADEPGFEPLKVRRSKRQAKGAARSPDYTVDSLPETSFTCEDKPSEGLYADVETQCQGFHLCQKVKGVMTLVSTFVCPHNTVFNQREGNCDSWADVDCSLYSQPEHSFDRKGNRKHRHVKRDISRISKPLDLLVYSNGEADNLQQNISSKIHRFNFRSENNATDTVIAAESLLRHSKKSGKSNSGNAFVQNNGKKWIKSDLKLHLQPTPPLAHKRIKHDVTVESNETEEEYYDYVDDSYEADLVPPEQENSNSTSHEGNRKLEVDDSTYSQSSKESIGTVTTHLPHISLNQLLTADNNQNDTDIKGSITTLPSVSSSSNYHENGMNICTENETCVYKEDLDHTGNKEESVTRSNNDHNTETSLDSTEEQLAHFDNKNNKTSTSHNDEYEYYDYYTEDIEDESDEIINYPTEQTTHSRLAQDSESFIDVNISTPHTLHTSSEKSNFSTIGSATSDVEVAGTGISDAQNKYNNFPAVVSEKEYENIQNKRFESSSQTATSEDDGENNKYYKSESIPVTQMPEISLETPISAVDDKYEYDDSASIDDGVQLDIRSKEVMNTNFDTTENLQKEQSDAKKEITLHQHITEATSVTSSYEDVTATQASGIKLLKLPEISNVHEERTDQSITLSSVVDHGHNTETDLLSELNISLESGLPTVVNVTLDDQNIGNLAPGNSSQVNMSNLTQHTTVRRKQSDENNSGNHLQNPLQSDVSEVKINDSPEITTPHTTTTQSTSTSQIPNLFQPPKPHQAYHGRYSTPVLPPVIIRPKDGAAHKPRVRNNRHKTKKTQNDHIRTTTETFVRSENGPIISVNDSSLSTDELTTKKNKIISANSKNNTENTLLISGALDKFKVEEKTEPIFQQDSFTHPEESITVVPSTETVFGQALLQNDLRVKTEGLDPCKGNVNCPHVQNQYTTFSPASHKFYDKHDDHFSQVSQNDGLLSEPTEKTLQHPNSLEQSTLRIFQANEERSKADELVLGTDIPPTSSGNVVDYVTITPKVQSFKDVSDIVTTESFFPTYTLSAINAQSSQKSNQDISRFVCSGKELYHYHPDPSDCRIFHYCSHGFHNQQVLDFKFMCENGTAFSTHTQKCENEDEVQSCSMTKK